MKRPEDLEKQAEAGEPLQEKELDMVNGGIGRSSFSTGIFYCPYCCKAHELQKDHAGAAGIGGRRVRNVEKYRCPVNGAFFKAENEVTGKTEYFDSSLVPFGG